MRKKALLAWALQAVGLSGRPLQQARLYAAERVQGRHQGSSAPIARHPDVRRMLTRMDALTLAARSITYVAVAAAGQSSASSGFSDRGALLTPIAKVFASEAALEIASLKIQVHGGLGYVEETGASQLLRDARAIPIYEGTNGIQAIDLVQRQLVPDGGILLSEEMSRWRRHAETVRSIEGRSAEHTSEHQSLMRHSYPVFCLTTNLTHNM